ncbi:MAG: HDIG domain-containing protein [Candidatus Omnitrophica bacterium]|nr:HDIG domain-containing protein [Candidatus Omnitrophota bacterium]
MKISLKERISYLQGGMAILVFLLLIAFCQIANLPLTIPLVLFLVGVHLCFVMQADFSSLRNLGLLLSLVLIPVIIKEYTDLTISPLFLPVASIGMLTILLFNDLHLAFVMSFVASVLGGLVLGRELMPLGLDISMFDLTLIYFVSSITAVYTAREARTWGTLMGSGVYVSLVLVVCMVMIHHDVSFIMSKEFFPDYILPLIFNGVISAVLVTSTLRIFEYLFGVLTNFSLLELSDFNQPLLKRMVLEAPGTYHHSLVVSNLSEAAADAIGANSFLTRVGAYYHDIGKMVKPEYFYENQLVGLNKHDYIEPSISKLVILNHVKEGIDLAKKYKLNPIIYDFIVQHHGTSLMHFFYQKALEEAGNDQTISEENYRYPGPKPQSRETAIVLMADSAEAATRSLDEPNPQKIEEVVRKIINNKFTDGQLDECTLTLKEINTVAESFSRVLSAMYHSRIKYPEKKNDNNNRDRKSSEEHPHQPLLDDS